MVISDISVELLDFMGSDSTVVDTARVSFNKTSDKYSDNQNERLIKYLSEHNHWSPFAHEFLQFRIKAPIFVARQLVKHQIGLSWNEVSRRYVDTSPEFYMPVSWRERALNKKQGSKDIAVDNSDEITDKFLEKLEDISKFYDEMIISGVAPELARIVLPQTMQTEWIWSGSLYAFARICNLRLDPHAQYETRIVAEQISKYAKDIFPISWKYLVESIDTNSLAYWWENKGKYIYKYKDKPPTFASTNW